MIRRFSIILMIALSAVMVSSCGGKHGSKKHKGADSLAVEAPKWEKMDPMDLELKPIKAFARDWMALATGNQKSMNSMTISWGTIGELWGKNVVMVYVSSDRATKKLMDKNSYFTVSAFPDTREYREALSYIGSHSFSEDPNKTETAGLKVEFSALGNPMFTDADLVIECKKIYSDEFKKALMPDDVRHLYDDLGVHTFYIGEITNIYTKPTPQMEESDESETMEQEQ